MRFLTNLSILFVPILYIVVTTVLQDLNYGGIFVVNNRFGIYLQENTKEGHVIVIYTTLILHNLFSPYELGMVFVGSQILLDNNSTQIKVKLLVGYDPTSKNSIYIFRRRIQLLVVLKECFRSDIVLKTLSHDRLNLLNLVLNLIKNNISMEGYTVGLSRAM